MDWLIELDKALFGLINGLWHIAPLDFLFPYWREKTTWIPLYALFAIWLIFRYKWNAVWVLIGAALVITLADQMSSNLIKPMVGRLRPCNEPGLDVRLLLDYCGSGKSFTSSHATNHFAIYVFIATLFGKHLPYLKSIGLLWAASIAYAQVYVGVHYPFDILAGALLGSLIGFAVAELLLYLDGKFYRNQIFPLRSR